VLEGPIADLYARRTKSTLWNPPTPFCVAVHPRLPFLTATIDRWIIQAAGHDDRGDLEIKNVGAFNSDWRDGKDIALPLYVQAQVQHQLAVTGFSWAVVAALVGGNSLKTIEVARNPEFITELDDFLNGAKVTLLWDGLPSHRSKKMRKFLASQRHWLVVERLPAYAPELNPVEGMWGNLKGTELANCCAETIDEVLPGCLKLREK
ncbi:MAG: transposase, partial [Syntrophorhabdales bacterium]